MPTSCCSLPGFCVAPSRQESLFVRSRPNRCHRDSSNSNTFSSVISPGPSELRSGMPPQPSIRFRLFRPPNHFSSASCSRPTPNIVEALFDCLIAGGRFGQVRQAALMQAIDQTVPLAATMSESVTRLWQWAKGRARPALGNDRMRSRNGRRLAA